MQQQMTANSPPHSLYIYLRLTSSFSFSGFCRFHMLLIFILTEGLPKVKPDLREAQTVHIFVLNVLLCF